MCGWPHNDALQRLTGHPAVQLVVGPTASAAGTGGPRRGGILRISGQIAGDLPGYDYARNGSSTIGSVANLAEIGRAHV